MPEKHIVKTITTCGFKTPWGDDHSPTVKIFNDGSTCVECVNLNGDKCLGQYTCTPKSPFSNSIDNVEKWRHLDCIFK